MALILKYFLSEGLFMHYLLGLYIAVLLSLQTNAEGNCLEKRYVFDIGSGSTKLEAYLVDKCENKIVSQFGDFRKSVRYQECISSSIDKKTITKECMKQGLTAIKAIKNHFNINCRQEKCRGIATAWSRKVRNSLELFDLFKSEGVHISTISQEEEGILGFKAVKTDRTLQGAEEDRLVIWDIGSGSFQLTTLKNKDDVYVYNGPYGNTNFFQEIKEQNLLQTNAGFENKRYFTKSELDIILPYAVEKARESVQKDSVITAKLAQKNIRVIGIGKLMYNSIKTELELENPIKKDTLKKFIYNFSDITFKQTKENFPKVDYDYMDLIQKSLIIVWSIMESSGIEQIEVLDSGDLADAVAVDPDYWH